MFANVHEAQAIARNAASCHWHHLSACDGLQLITDLLVSKVGAKGGPKVVGQRGGPKREQKWELERELKRWELEMELQRWELWQPDGAHPPKAC